MKTRPSAHPLSVTPRRRARCRSNRRAFTLTEIMISMAMVALLLVGIGRIFALTSQTISTGQALSKAVRTQRAIQQTISADVLGVLPTSGNVRASSGIMPANAESNRNDGMPFLQICNFRTPTYLSDAERRADPLPPADVTTMLAADFAAHSLAVRGTDLDKNGTEARVRIDQPNGEMVPLFFYGDRNFRCDTIGFFSRGQFQSQTGVSGVTTGASTSLQSELKSGEAFIWYGHTRVYNSDAANFDRSAAFGNPGDWLVSGGKANANNRFASQFILGRVQMLLVEPIDHDARPGSYTTTPEQGGADRKLAEDNTVVASNDPEKPAIFLQRKWWDPTSHELEANETNWQNRTRPLFSPFTPSDPVVIFQRDTATANAGRNRTLYTSDRTTPSGTSSLGKADTNYQALFGRTDVVGVGAPQARQRSRFLHQYDTDFPPSNMQSTGDRYEWWEKIYTTWNARFWANPFIASSGFNAGEPSVNAKSLAQRQQIMATGVSQLIVEFAGDFVTQRTDATPATRFGEVIDIVPDGVQDFVATTDGNRATRWYGLPRDVDANGSIPGTPAGARASVDVLPVHRIIPISLFPTGANPWLPFERTITASVTGAPAPPSMAPVNGDYANNLDEPGTAVDPGRSGYVCVWGAQDFERVYENNSFTTLPNPRSFRGAYPTMIRFIVDVVDERGKLAEPVTQELVYPVPDDLAPVQN